MPVITLGTLFLDYTYFFRFYRIDSKNFHTLPAPCPPPSLVSLLINN